MTIEELKQQFVPKRCSSQAEDGDVAQTYTTDGRMYPKKTNDDDLMMATTKHEGWVNVYTPSSEGKYIVSAVAYDTEADAKKAGLNKSESYVATVKIEWEE